MEFSIWDFLATLLNFALLLFILYKLLWKKLINAMDSRKNQIDESLEKAELARKEVSETKTKISADIENARRQAREIVEQSQRAGEEAKNAILKQANEAADAALVRAQEEIEQQKISAISDIKSEVAQLVIMVTEKV
ncbi:MAG: F0F1 ATP synthase subunit B, partial [Clostridia bacterium]|nr:F0F1 ATP synthase subunit B [Clostridia bacterium]